MLTNVQIQQFHEDGILIIPKFYDEDLITSIQAGIYKIIGQIMVKYDIPDTRAPFSPANFDEGYLDVIGRNRAWGGEIYDAVKQIPAFIRLVAHPSNEEIFSELRENSLAGVVGGGYGIRIDNPSEDKYRAMWHQEYPAQLKSLDGLVFWSPLVEITEELGPVAFCLGSQKGGALPVYEADPEQVGRTGAYALKLFNEEQVISKYDLLAPLTEPGDLVIIDFLVLHASGFNRAARSRWSMQFRYFNFAEPTGRSHGWSGSYASGVDFRIIHPELFIQS